MRRGQLLAAGLSASTIARMMARGSLITIHPGVLAVGHCAPTPLSRETAALLAMRDGAALSHDSAAGLWEYPSVAATPDAIHITVPGSNGGRPGGVHVHRSRILQARDVRLRDGLPVTSPERTMLDRAPALTARDLERDLEHALRRTAMRLRDLRRLLDRAGAHHGRRVLTRLLDARTTATFTRSEAEERFLALVRDAGLPDPLLNVRRHGYELDFLWPAARLAVEIDGFAFHGNRVAFERDRRKSMDLQAAGFEVARVSWRQVTEVGTATIVAIAQMLAVRGGPASGPGGGMDG